MYRIAKATAITAIAGAAVLGTAGGALAHDNDNHRHGASAEAVAVGSPGVLSGNVIQVPIHIPINVCGNSINIVALLNPAIGNTCINK
ncbi:chaplin [Streptomyces sp. NBC_01537]|uniref:chaplin n=1 Tax=Streptomyces sp. NBC_01537 TaxID=2903896 RepID=UPI00386EE5B4